MYDDFYAEPSEFEQLVDEFKQSLINSVKQEFKEEMEVLRKENAELQEFKKERQKIINEYENLKRSLQYEKEAYERQIKQKRLDELLGEPLENAYGIKREWILPPKCEFCDAERKLKYKNPVGKDVVETCSCGNVNKCVFTPIQLTLYKFSRYKKDREPYYYFQKTELDDRYEYGGVRIVPDTLDFEKYPTYNTVIISKERAQAYCDWLNSNTK